MISVETSDIPDKKWNSRLLDTNLGTIYQSKEHANFAEKIEQDPLFLKFVNHIGMVPFVIYRIVLGAAILMI